MAEGLRFDRFCWNVRLAPTRAAAVAISESGHARINGRRIEKASALVHPGDILTLPRGNRVYVVRVLQLPPRRIGAPLVASMIEEIDANPPSA